MKLLVAGTLVGLALVGGAAVYLNSDESQGGPPIFVVGRGPLTISVTERGRISNRDQVEVKSEVEGRPTILWVVAEGTHVQAGDLLLELDSSELVERNDLQQITVLNAEAAFVHARENLAVTKSQAESDIAEAKLAYKFAQLDRKKYLQGEYPQQLRQAEADITIAREELGRANDKLDWSRRLAGEGYITRTELQADELAAKRTQLNLELAESKLALLKEFTYQRNLEQLTSDVEQAEKALDRVQRKASADLVQAEADLKAKESEYNRQKAQLEKVKEQITKCRITAPVAGMVVYATTGKANWRGNLEPLQEGQQVRERQDLIYLPTTTSVMAEVKVHESSLRKVQAGMPVRVTVDELPGREFFGRVTKIGLLPDGQSRWLNPDLKVYSTEIVIEGNNGDLRAGRDCQAEIIVKQYEDAVYVPVQSVVRVGGKSVVYLPGANGPVMREVEVGLDNNRMIRIVSGLQEGEAVLAAPPLGSAGVGESREMPDGEVPALPFAATAPSTSPAAPEESPRPTTRQALDPRKLRDLSPEQRRKLLEGLTPKQREELMNMRRQRGAGRRRPGGSATTGRSP